MNYSMWYNATRLLSVGGLECGGTEYVFEQHPTHRTHSLCRRTPGLRPTTICWHYTACCNSQSCAPEDGQRIARKMFS